HGQGAGRDRRAAREAHSGRIAPALRRELPSAARARLHRAAAAGFLEIRRRKTGTPLGQKIELVERRGIVPVRRSLGKRWDELHSKKEAHLKVGVLEPQPSVYQN